MTLFTVTLLTGCILMILGGLFISNNKSIEQQTFLLLRSDTATAITFGLAAVWFLWHITQLGEADFGNYRRILLIAFAGLALLSFLYLRDFLVVRGIAILILLTARVVLDSTDLHPSLSSRLFLVAFVYLAIIIALYLGALPFRLRDFLEWLFTKKHRRKWVGGFLAMYGLLLLVIAFSYSF